MNDTCQIVELTKEQCLFCTDRRPIWIFFTDLDVDGLSSFVFNEVEDRRYLFYYIHYSAMTRIHVHWLNSTPFFRQYSVLIAGVSLQTKNRPYLCHLDRLAYYRSDLLCSGCCNSCHTNSCSCRPVLSGEPGPELEPFVPRASCLNTDDLAYRRHASIAVTAH